MIHTLTLEKPRCTLECSRPLEGSPRIAIVGSRNAEGPILDHVADLAEEIAKAGGIVVGCGEGKIEAAAHRWAVAAGGRSWLLASVPRGHVMPPEQARIFEHVLRSEGAVVWPSPADTATYTAEKRGAVLAALSDAIVVAHARTYRSRCLSVAAHAIDAGKPVWVVPPTPWLPHAEGTHVLMRRPGVKTLWRTLDLLASVKLTEPAPHVRRKDPAEQMVVAALTKPLHPDRLVALTHLKSSELAVILFELQVDGVVRLRLDGCFELV